MQRVIKRTHSKSHRQFPGGERCQSNEFFKARRFELMSLRIIFGANKFKNIPIVVTIIDRVKRIVYCHSV